MLTGSSLALLVALAAPGCTGTKPAQHAARSSSPPTKMVVQGNRVAFNDVSSLETYEQTWDLQDRSAATNFANMSLQHDAAVQLQDQQTVEVTAEVDSADARDGENCHVRTADGAEAWAQCSWLGDLSTPMPYGKSGTFDADDADSRGNPVGYLFATKREMCAYAYAAATNAKTRPIPLGAFILRGRQEIKARLITSLPGYGCSDSFEVDANYVEVLQGRGRGDRGWTAVYSDEQ